MSDSCSKSHLEMVRLVRFRLISDKFLYMNGKRMMIPDRYVCIVETQYAMVIENSTCV